MIWKSMPEVEEVKRGKGNAGEQSQDFISQTCQNAKNTN